jgi:hypothetical protein
MPTPNELDRRDAVRMREHWRREGEAAERRRKSQSGAKRSAQLNRPAGKGSARRANTN